MTITEFLLARIAEDEAAVRAAVDQGGDPDREPWLAVGWPACEHPGRVVLVGPERFLAECEAKRRIVQSAPWANNALTGGAWTMPVGDFILKQMAAVYADHPDFDEAWKP